MIGKSNGLLPMGGSGLTFKKSTSSYTVFDMLHTAGYHCLISIEDGEDITPLTNIQCKTSFKFTGHSSYYTYAGTHLFFNTSINLLNELGLNELENGKYLIGIVTPNRAYIDSKWYNAIPLGSLRGTNIQVTDGNITVLDDSITVIGTDTSERTFSQFHVYMCIKYP